MGNKIAAKNPKDPVDPIVLKETDLAKSYGINNPDS